MKRPGWSRLWQSARLRRAVVYVVATILIIYAGLTAVHLALPPDPYGPIRVETLPGYSGGAGAEPTKVTYDAKTGSTFLEVTEDNGSVKRYRIEKDTAGWRVYSDSQ